MTVIGLSFGNSCSAIAIERDGKVDLIANQDGDHSIPSTLSYVGHDEFHGQQAKNQLIRNPATTIANFRDAIGAPFAKIDPSYSEASAKPLEHQGQTCYRIQKAKGENDTTDVEGTEHELEDVYMSIDEVAVRHLARLKDSAEDFLGEPVDGVVLAVPTDFSESQRTKLAQLAGQAGLRVMQTINEPTAALLSYVSSSLSVAAPSASDDKLFVVTDFGGVRSDGAVVAYRGGIFTILSTLHDYELGGKLVDRALVDYVSAEFLKKNPGQPDPRSEPRSLAKMLAEAEAVKKTLANTASASFAVESIAGGNDYGTTVQRLRFELAARDVFARFADFARRLVEHAKIDVLDVDEVLLVGGSSFTPKVVSVVGGLFDAHKTKIITPATADGKLSAPNELIAKGAAVQASLVADFDADEIKESLEPVVTVAAHVTRPIGIKIADDGFKVVIDANTAVPIRKTVTVKAGAKYVVIGVYEGQTEITTKTLEPAAEEADGEEDWSDDEPEEVRERVVRADRKIAEAILREVEVGAKIEVSLTVTRELKVQIAAREVKANGSQVRGTA